MKILITGGAGYKGLLLAKELLVRGHEVTVLDNFMYGVEPTLFLFSFPKVSFQRYDVRNLTEKDLSRYDCIYHLAAISGYPACEANPHSALMINVNATQRMMTLLGQEQLLVYASTTSIYGKSDKDCFEDTEVNPASLYAKTKLEAEKLCMQRPNSVSLRFATLFGVAPRMRWDLLLNNFVMKALQERTLVIFDPKSTRTFLHVADAIKAYLMVLDLTDRMLGGVYNVGCREMNYSKIDLANKIKAHFKFEIICSNLEDLDVRNFYINFDKIAALGFSPDLSVEFGIAELVKLFQYYNPVESYRVI